MKAKAQKIVTLVLHNLVDRRGIDNVWDDIDASVKAEIRETLEEIVLEVLNE